MLKSDQILKLIKVLNNANKNSMYYKKILQNYDIEKITYDEFLKIPIMEKETLKNEMINLLPENFDEKKFDIETTSGSSGIPLKIPRNNIERVLLSLPIFKCRAGWINEIPDPTRAALISHFANDVASSSLGSFLALRLKDLSDENLEIQCNRLLEYKPQILSGPPRALEKLAEYANRKQIDMKQINIKLIECRSEYLFEKQRDLCECTFGCPAVKMYGCHETWGIAYECKGRNLHVLEDSVFVEVVDENNNPVGYNEIGDIVITLLIEQTLPIIRYKLGDKVILRENKCSCGSSKDVIELIGTRNSEWITTPSGLKCTTNLFPLISQFSQGKYDFIKQFQIIQKSISKFELNIRTDETIDFDLCEDFKRQFQVMLGYPIDLVVNINSEFIVNKKSMKLSWFYSDID